MEQYLPQNEVEYVFDIKTQCKIKLIAAHPTKPWVCFFTVNKVFQLWDWERRICLKTFGSSQMDSGEPAKALEVKSLLFVDQDSLLSLPQSQGFAMTEAEQQ